MILAGFFDSLARSAATVAVSSLWQGVAVALALALCLKFSPRISAAQRFMVWFAGFLAIAASPLLPLVLKITSQSGAPMFAAPATTSSDAWFQLDARWTLAVVALWLIASTARGADLVFHVVRLRRLWRQATPIEVAFLPPSRRKFQVCATQSLDRPSVIGFFAPRVLIPEWLLPRLSPGELEQIVLHESTHLARRDDWTNLFQKLCLVLFPLNPGLWAIDRKLAKEREMACDEAVVRVTQAPRAYAACLAGLAERGLAHRKEALSLGAWQRRSELAKRVHRILADRRSLSPASARVLLAAFGCSLLVVTVELARCPKLVAFVPAVQTANRAPLAMASTQLGDAVYPTNPRSEALTADAHLVETKAEMPAPSSLRQLARRDHRRFHAEEELRAASLKSGKAADDLRDLAARQGSETSPHAQPRQQLIVFTAWEQIETATPTSQTTIADYETQPAVDANSSPKTSSTAPEKNNAPSAAGDTSAAQISQHRTMVTQLILRIVPSGSKSTHPAAIPLGDGWFVIQL